MIDGFIRKNSGGSAPTSPKISNNSDNNNLASQKGVKAHFKHAAQSVHTKTQHSQTLMRNGVRRPAKVLKEAAVLRAPKARVLEDPSLKTRAQSVGKSSRISHFSKALPAVTNLARPSKAATQEVTVIPQAKKELRAKANARPLPSMVSSVSHQQLERLLDHALLNADAHKKALENNKSLWNRLKRAPRLATIGSATLIVLLLGGFFAWQNIPQVSMRVAATKAHVNAQVPSYTPPGFSLKAPIKATNGSVTMQFKADADNSRTFSITQKNSTMDSKSLADTTPNKTSTGQVDGNTVIIYGDKGDATWVNHGIQYTVKDAAQLNTDQLLKIANGL